MVRIRYEQMKGPLLGKTIVALSKKLVLTQRKTLLPVVEKLRAFENECKAEADRILFKYAKEAPDNWPNAGQLVLDTSLMTQEDHAEFVVEDKALAGRVLELDWDRIPVNIKEMADKISLLELEVAEILFEVLE